MDTKNTQEATCNVAEILKALGIKLGKNDTLLKFGINTHQGKNVNKENREYIIHIDRK